MTRMFPTHRAIGIPLFVLSLVALSATAFAQDAPDLTDTPGDWPYAFPLMGDKLARRGMKFPLPFGIGLNYAYVDQPIEISRVAVGVNDSEMVDLTDFIKFDKLNSKVHVLNLRADLWVFPFLNFYAMGNFVPQSKTQVSISEPFSFDAGATQSGYGGGFGFTLAMGAWGFFGTLDLNWTWNKLQKLEIPVGTYLLTPRIGKNFGKVAGVDLILWIGGMRQYIQSDTRGSIRLKDAVSGAGDGSWQQKLQDWYNGLPPCRQAIVKNLVDRIDIGGGDPVIHYDLDKAVANPWNMLVGTEIGLSDAWRLRAEVGFIHRTQFLFGINYRFGGFLGPAPEEPAPPPPTLQHAPPPHAQQPPPEPMRAPPPPAPMP